MARFTGGGSGSGSGAPGPRGPQGDSAYEVAVDNAFVGTEQEWLDSLVGGGGTADIADFVFTSGEGQSVISLPGDKGMRIEAGVDSDLYLTAGDDLYIQTLGQGDDIHLNAADDIRFTTNNEDSAFSSVPTWRMNSEGRFELPGNGYISNPYAETVTTQTYTVSFSDNYLNNQSGLSQAYAVYLPVISDSSWFVNNFNITSPVTITFADSTTTTTVAIYDATNQGTPAVIFQWDDQERNKTFAETFPLTISAQYNNISYGASTIELDPEWYGNDQKIVIDATAPNHIHVRAGGNIDESTAELYLGGEKNHVAVSDAYNSLTIRTAAGEQNTYVNANELDNADLMVPDTADIVIGDNIVINGTPYPVTYFSPDPNNTGFSIVNAAGLNFISGNSYTFVREESYGNAWTFDSNGYLHGPAMGGLFVSGILNGESDLWLSSNDNVVLNGNDGGEFLGNADYPANQIATIGDLDSIAPTTIPGSSSIFLALVRFATNTTSYAAYSADGITWTLTTMPQDAGWTSSIYAEGKYVATGFGVSAHSLNGIDWTLGTGSLFARNTTYGNGKFIGVGNSGGVSYSEDGVSWTYTARALPAGPESYQNDWLDVAYGGGKFVAVRLDPGVFAYSEDGITWSQATGSPGDSFWYSVTYGNDRFVAVGVFGGTAYSLDGINWTRSSSNSGFSITYGDGKFVAVAGNSVKHSADGITWTVGSMPINAFAVTYGNGKFVAVSNSSNESAYSVDGINWTASTLPISDEWHSVSASNVELDVPLQIASEKYVNDAITDLASSISVASASYHSRVTQGPQVSANTVQPFTFSSTDWETGILRVDNTKIKMLSAGKYNIAFSAQLVQGNNAGTLNIWLNKNGTPMAYTNTKVTIESNATYTVAAWNFFVDAATDDYYELIWSSSSTNTTIQYNGAETINGNLHPEIPSIIVTVNQVG